MWEIPSFLEHSWGNSFFWVFEMPPSPRAAAVPGVDQVDGEGMHKPQSPVVSGVPILESHRLWCSRDAAGPEPGIV